MEPSEGLFWFLAVVFGALLANIPPFITSLAAWRRSRATGEEVPRLIEELREEVRAHQRDPFHPGAAYHLDVLQRRLDELEKLARRMPRMLDERPEDR